MNKATVSQWGRLYDIALDIKELQPWEKLRESDLIALESPMSEETVYFSFMGKNRSSFGISCFIGQKGLEGFYDLTDCRDGARSELLFKQNSLVAYFGAQKDVTQEDAALIKSLKLCFDRDGDWLYFRCFEPGYVPWPLNLEEVLLLTDLYGALYTALKELFEDAVPVDFTKQIFCRRMNPETGAWISEVMPRSTREKQIQNVSITDELMLARIMKRPLVDARLELDVFNIMIEVEDEEYKKPFYPAMILLADAASGRIVEFEVFTPKDSETEHVIALILGFIEKHGRPLIIYLQNPRLQAILGQLCRSTAIPLEMVNFLPSINAFKLEKGITKSTEDNNETEPNGKGEEP